jgi:GNAT superfamily N-acetyltransferase
VIGTVVRNTKPEDFVGIIHLCRQVYPESPPWTTMQLSSHVTLFPEGQFVAVRRSTGAVTGMAASLIVRWDDYGMDHTWRDVTDHGMFTNHDPVNGRTLYGAEVMVDPSVQRAGIGKKLYQARRELVERLGLRRIRAAARLRGYHRHAGKMSAEDYVIQIVRGKLKDPTLSFQLKQGFEVIGIVSGYLLHDPESLGYAAVIEWLNPQVSTPGDTSQRDPRFLRKAGGSTRPS